MSRPPFTPIIEALPATVPFVGPETIVRETGRPFRARLGANESGFGPAPSVIAKMREVAPEVWAYGDAQNHDIRAALAAHLGVGLENVTVGEGIDGLLGLTCRLFLSPGDRVVTSLGAYPTFNYHVAAQGAALATVPYVDDRESLESLLAATREEPTRIVYLANPDNPMGTVWTADKVAAFIAAVPEETLIVLDEAYCETAPQSAFPAFDTARPNLLRFRTFSKAYGLAGMRVGYAVGHQDVIAGFDRIRNHFGVTRMSQAAALAALADQAYLAEVVAKIARARETIYAFSSNLGLATIPSATNFVAIDCGRDHDYALAVLNGLAERGVFVRKPAAPVLNRCIRMSVGPDEELAIAAEALEDTLRA
ncbi:pyridoxal phosphate-dependent aminotransferase [Pelagibacterium halotolerans]|uniref:pyridoxal phosphate-dependent aminotransferase n=1 Tax=Pelagibacterium halotolerans TaxID=531813 RepID=UPI00384A6DDD